MCHTGRRTYLSDWRAPRHGRHFCSDPLTSTLGDVTIAPPVLDNANLIVSVTATHGRGLAIIDSIATSWGTTYRPTGKQVRATTALPIRLSATVNCSTQTR
jgi:hypothetical protein